MTYFKSFELPAEAGELIVRIGDERRTCGAGDIAVIPPNVLHGFQVVRDTLMEVVAEYDIGTLFPVRQPDGSRRLVEVYRQHDGKPPRRVSVPADLKPPVAQQARRSVILRSSSASPIGSRSVAEGESRDRR